MTITAVAVVAIVAAVVSYMHVYHLAQANGEEWRAVIAPLSVDGLLVAASMVMLLRRRAGRRAGALPWTGLILGLLASLAANVAPVQPHWITKLLVSGWPPIALAVSFELLIIVLRDQSPNRAQTVGDDLAGAGEDEAEPGETWEQLRDRLLAEGLGRRELARQLGVKEHEARALIDAHRKASAQRSGRVAQVRPARVGEPGEQEAA